MRTIGVVTVGRSDYGIYLPILERIRDDHDLRLHLIVSGMHLSPEFGLTVRMIENDGFQIGDRVEMLLSSDTPEGIAKSIGLGSIGFAQSYARYRPDLLLVLGDRFEMLAAVVAALPFGMPLAHIHGGESTEGAIDEAMRHAITKMSHLHFVTTEEYGRRVIQLGEEPWRVTVSGAPSLDNLRRVELLARDELAVRYGLRLTEQFLLVTYHPVTLEYDQTETHMEQLLAALDEFDMATVFTYPNADTRSHKIIEMVTQFVAQRPLAQLVRNLGTQGYFSLMASATAMVGNSSSGIIEAASFHLPVVNVGNRQRGRVHGKNVVDVGYSAEEIRLGLREVLAPEFRRGLADLENPYGDGHAAERIVSKLKQVALDSALLQKHFHVVS